MVNLLDFVPVKRKEVEKILKFLDKIGKKNPIFSGFKIYNEKNNRGDYGVNNIYTYKGNDFLVTSIDGARIDVRFYVSPQIKDILKQIESDAK